jgi:hypothetical protein
VLVWHNASGVFWLVFSLILALALGLYYYPRYLAEQQKLDERERHIEQKATALSTFVYVMFCCCFSFVLFFIVGGAGEVPVYALPAICVGALFVAQFTASAAILILAREQADG